MELMLDRRDRKDLPSDARWITGEMIERDQARSALLICKVRTGENTAAYLLLDKTAGAAIYTKDIATWQGDDMVSRHVGAMTRGLRFITVPIEPPAGQAADYYKLTETNRAAVESRIKDLMARVQIEHGELFAVSHYTERGLHDGNQWQAEVVDATIGAVRIDSKMFFCQHNIETGQPAMLYNGWKKITTFPADGITMEAAKKALAQYDKVAPQFFATATKRARLTPEQRKQAVAERLAAIDKVLRKSTSFTSGHSLKP